MRTVVIIASGPTEGSALPSLLRKVIADHELTVHVTFPPRNKPLGPNMAARLIRAAWERYAGQDNPIHKVVVLIDADAEDRIEKVKKFGNEMFPLVRNVMNRGLAVLVAAAKWHLEAWFFADTTGLRRYFKGRDIGPVNDPEEIPFPKNRLKQLVYREDIGIYTALVAGEIAAIIDPSVVRARAPSFRDFEQAVVNGH